MGVECDLTCSEIETRGLRALARVRRLSPIPPLTRHSLSAANCLRARHGLGMQEMAALRSQYQRGGGQVPGLAWVVTLTVHPPPRPTSPDRSLPIGVFSHVHMMNLR